MKTSAAHPDDVFGPIIHPRLLDRREVCIFFGGTSRPINAATLYRGIKLGRYPQPVKVGPGSSRWLRAECEAALRQMAEGRAVKC
jgi:predicted DNA-binding transcriptional regulator AlpA